jgi:ribosomal-protein-alanine N-acetyltransferase
VAAPADDIDRIMEVMAAAFDPEFGEAWSRRQIEDALLSGLCHYKLSDAAGTCPLRDGAAAGFYLSRLVADEEELLLIAVSPQYRRCGIASILLRTFTVDAQLRGSKRLLLEMRKGNPAESLYRKFGFRVIGERPNYYRIGSGSPRDAVTFACEIGG